MRRLILQLSGTEGGTQKGVHRRGYTEGAHTDKGGIFNLVGHMTLWLFGM
jgi:hypothetical protein